MEAMKKKISNFESFLNERFSDFFELHQFFQYCLKNVHLCELIFFVSLEINYYCKINKILKNKYSKYKN